MVRHGPGWTGSQENIYLLDRQLPGLSVKIPGGGTGGEGLPRQPGREELGSTTDLVLGDAGRLLAMLRGFASRAKLAAAASSGSEHQASEPPREELSGDGVSLADALVRAMPAAFAALQAWRPRRQPAENAGPGPVLTVRYLHSRS